MNNYLNYMDRQQVSPELHERLLAMEAPKKTPHWQKYAALAACLAVIVGLGVWKLWPAKEQSAADVLSEIGVLGNHELDLPDIPYPESKTGEFAADIALPDGAMTVELTAQQIDELLGTVNQVFPGVWGETASVTGQAIYDGYGKLWEVNLWSAGENGGSAYLELAPGSIPPTCVGVPDGAVTVVNGVEVMTWGSHYDSNGDGVKEYHYNSAFLAHDVGIRAMFQSTEECADSDNFIYEATKNGALTLAHIAQLEDVPDFRSVGFSEYGEALSEPDFLPYLPETVPAGFEEFGGKLVYQEGIDNHLVVWWRRGQDSLHLYIDRPEDRAAESCTTVDIDAPETWDLRLYGRNRWDESLPFDLRDTLDFPTFRAEDMSRSVIEARQDGNSYQFQILHPDGTAVQYSVYGLSVDEVWAIAEPTL